MAINGLYVTFALYLIAMVLVGIALCGKSKSTADYFLGGRGLGSWVTALSAQASDMGGWLLMGLPGAMFVFGLGEFWVGIGLFFGTMLNWMLVASRLRRYTERVGAITVSGFLTRRFRDPSGLLRTMSGLVTLLFFTIYVTAGLVSVGKLFNMLFHIDYRAAVVIGGAVILFYTVAGGYFAVCWTDVIQGMLMLLGIVVVPTVAICANGGLAAAVAAGAGKDLSLFPSATNGLTWLKIASMSAWGLGYFGMPHIICRFMSIRSSKLIPRAMAVALTWLTFSMVAVVGIVFAAWMTLPNDLGEQEAEKIFIMLTQNTFSPWLGGIMLAAVMAAIMSTIDSQTLIAGSTLFEDFYSRIIRHNVSLAEAFWVSRISVLIIAATATGLALFEPRTIFSIVEYAWSGFGAAIGPVVIMALYSRRTTWLSASIGMFVGAAVMLIWHKLGLHVYMYQIVPGFVANFIVMLLIDTFRPQRDSEVLAEFDDVNGRKL
ncbi:MAG: sodium/proline symporter [Victivallaceae bacterium]|nr:sodium/proline symporter [Victivallaceae bacterium]